MTCREVRPSYFDTRAAVDGIKPGAYATLPYTSRVLAENLVLCQVAMASGGRLRMVEIADQLSIGKSAVTKSVDRLDR